MAEIEKLKNSDTRSRGPGTPAGDRRRPGERPHGRYDRRSHSTRMPADGLGQMPKSRNADMTVAAIEDVYGDGKERLYATVNRRVDVLEYERSHERISEAAYRTGRLVQTIFERSGRVGGSNWCGTSRIDPMLAQELNVIRTICNAKDINELNERIRGRIGMRDARILRHVLCDRTAFAELAEREGKRSERYTAYIASRFRDALEDLAESWFGRGAPRRTPDDKHRDAALEMGDREKRSIAAGVTEARRAEQDS